MQYADIVLEQLQKVDYYEGEGDSDANKFDVKEKVSLDLHTYHLSYFNI